MPSRDQRKSRASQSVPLNNATQTQKRRVSHGQKKEHASNAQNRNTVKRRRRALIAGGAGFIGSHLAESLLKQGYFVFAVDNFRTGRRVNIEPLLAHPHFSFFPLDITEPAFFHKFSSIHLDEIYNLACPTGVPNLGPLAEEMLLTSSIGARQTLELARIHNARLLFTSTAEIYGQPEVVPIPEHYSGNVHPLGPRSAYEEGKRFAESLHSMYVRKFGVDARIVRVFNTYGPNMSLDDKRVIPQFVRSVIEGTPLIVYGDGSQTRSHIYVDDQISGIRAVMERGIPGEAYNIGGSVELSIRELAETVLRIAGITGGISFVPHFIEDHRRRAPLLDKAMALGWRQEIPLEAGLAYLLAHHHIIPPASRESLGHSSETVAAG